MSLNGSQLRCDWLNKTEFDQCIKSEIKISDDIAKAKSVMESYGFSMLPEQENPNFVYFLKKSNSISGYKISVLITIANGVVADIRVR